MSRGIAVRSVEIEFVELPVLGADIANGAGDRAHHHGLGLDQVLAKFHPGQHGAGGDTGRGEQAIALHHVLDVRETLN